jgi:ribosomal protein L11 methyltransferase
MAMKRYIDLCLNCCGEELAEIATAFLADYPFESFDARGCDEGVELHAFILEECWTECREEALAAVAEYASSISESVVEDENWNQRWEQESFEAVDIDSKILIRAPYHEPPTDAEVMDIVVTPRMSFGSGHHTTTRMMSRAILAAGCTGRVLDVGCGTGVLSFVALKGGAAWVDAVDVDPWSVESAREAAALNGLSEHMEIVLGTVEAVEDRSYDMVVANINRNIILGDMPRYVAAMREGATLLLSGFLRQDVEDIVASAESYGLRRMAEQSEEEWMSLGFTK